MSDPAAPESLVLNCLNEAELLLQIALRQLESGQPLNTENANGADTSLAATTSTERHEPDDFAAAFFVAQQQSKLKGTSSSTILSIHAWARTIFSTRELRKVGDKHVDIHQTVALNDDVEDGCRRASSTGADELCEIFHAAYGA